MDLRRLLRHLSTTRPHVRRYFPSSALEAIKSAIAKSEGMHRGEIRFVIEAALDPVQLSGSMTPRERALEVFSELRIWDTRDNSGVLIYVLFADRAIEIVADRGIHGFAGTAVWTLIAAQIQAAFADGEYLDGALLGVQAVSEQLQRHLPRYAASPGELPDDVTLL